MNTSGLLPYQPPHAVNLMKALLRRGAVLDGSDCGLGKTYTALAVCREMGITPLVVAPKNSRSSWAAASVKMGTPIEWINYEMVRGRREMRGGKKVDKVVVTKDPLDPFRYYTAATFQGKHVARLHTTWDMTLRFFDGKLPKTKDFEPFTWSNPEPILVKQTYTSESDWIEEVKLGKGSKIRWKQPYVCIIFDEVHRCGGSTSLQSKLLIAAKRQAKFIICLSATAADDPRQMRALGFALGLHTLNGEKTGFRAWLWKHGCVAEDDGAMVFSEASVKQRETFKKLHEEIFPVCGARLRKKEIPNFPHSNIIAKPLFDHTGKAARLTAEQSDLAKKFGVLALSDSTYIANRRKLELLMVPDVFDFVKDIVPAQSLMIFVNFTETLDTLVSDLMHTYGSDKVGYIDGSQIGPAGARQRDDFIRRFQLNELPIIVSNCQAGGEAISGHDPTGRVERTTLIMPCDSGRRLKQVFGRVDRAEGADSTQYLLYFAGTEQEKVAKRVLARVDNLDLLNDGELI